MVQHLPPRRRTGAFLVACLLLVGAAGCGSSDSSSSSDPGGSSATGDSPGSPGSGDDASTPDPCRWYTAEEMSTLVGFEVTMTRQETPLGPECNYDSDAEFAKITVRPTDAATYDSLKTGTASMSTQVDYPGVGDAAYHNVSAERLQENNQPSVAMSAKKGDVGIDVELASAGSPALSTTQQGIEITTAIAKKALGD